MSGPRTSIGRNGAPNLSAPEIAIIAAAAKKGLGPLDIQRQLFAAGYQRSTSTIRRVPEYRRYAGLPTQRRSWTPRREQEMAPVEATVAAAQKTVVDFDGLRLRVQSVFVPELRVSGEVIKYSRVSLSGGIVMEGAQL